MHLRKVQATRYVTALREGGSLPAIVEADDSGLYVVKFHGAGQGPLALVAEVIGGEIGRALGLEVPELVLLDLDPALDRNEPDQEVQDLLRRSRGLNLAMDYLPGSINFDPAALARNPGVVDPAIASLAVWFDAFITNVDRTARNTNLLWWHRQLRFIDHGAAFYFHHNWPDDLAQAAANKFAPIKDHVLLRWAADIQQAAAVARARLTPATLEEIVSAVPAEWLGPEPGVRRSGYLTYLKARLEAASVFTEEAIRARNLL